MSQLKVLCVIERFDSKATKPSTEVRIEYFDSQNAATKEAIKWAKKLSCRVFGITESLAKKIYPKVKIKKHTE